MLVSRFSVKNTEKLIGKFYLSRFAFPVSGTTNICYMGMWLYAGKIAVWGDSITSARHVYSDA